MELEELKRDLSKKQKFEEAVGALRAMVAQMQPPSDELHSAITRAAAVLRSRYTSGAFWAAGLSLFQEALALDFTGDQKADLRSSISMATDFLAASQSDSEQPSAGNGGGYLFEGHLTVDPEPPTPPWLLLSNAADTSLIQQSLIDSLIMTTMEEHREPLPPRVPPASKAAVALLPIITLTEDTLAKLGQDAECAICKDHLALHLQMQQLPCNHIFHPPCLKPWLDEHNSCPICRHELQTDDHHYESWKERQKEAAEERKGAANALPGGEFMYV